MAQGGNARAAVSPVALLPALVPTSQVAGEQVTPSPLGFILLNCEGRDGRVTFQMVPEP